MIAQAQLTFDKVLTFDTRTGRPPGVCFSNFLSCKSFVDTELLQWGFLGMRISKASPSPCIFHQNWLIQCFTKKTEGQVKVCDIENLF